MCRLLGIYANTPTDVMFSFWGPRSSGRGPVPCATVKVAVSPQPHVATFVSAQAASAARRLTVCAVAD